MSRFALLVGLEPFLQHPIRRDLVRREPSTLGLQLALQFSIHAKNLRRTHSVAKEFAQLLHVDCWAEANTRARLSIGLIKTILRRSGRTGHEPLVFRFFIQVEEIEFHTTAHNRVNLRQIVLIQGEGILLPQVLTEPCRSTDVHSCRCGVAPDVCQSVRNPTG